MRQDSFPRNPLSREVSRKASREKDAESHGKGQQRIRSSTPAPTQAHRAKTEWLFRLRSATPSTFPCHCHFFLDKKDMDYKLCTQCPRCKENDSDTKTLPTCDCTIAMYGGEKNRSVNAKSVNGISRWLMSTSRLARGITFSNVEMTDKTCNLYSEHLVYDMSKGERRKWWDDFLFRHLIVCKLTDDFSFGNLFMKISTFAILTISFVSAVYHVIYLTLKLLNAPV